MIRLLILISLVLAGCQSNPSRNGNFTSDGEVSRTPSTSSVLVRTFIRELAAHSGHSAAAIERQAIQYIQRQARNNAHGNWSEIGITREEAMRIESLYDDLPYMNKVRKWVQNNVHRVITVQRAHAELAYAAMMRGRSNVSNPYTREAFTLAERLASARNRFKPAFDTIGIAQHRVNLAVSELGAKARNLSSQTRKKIADLTKRYKDALLTYVKRGRVSPSIAANGNEIVESATTITRKTGHEAMGPGCKEFSDAASVETLARKADVDIERAARVEELAHQKAGKAFDSFDEIDEAKRLTQREIDDATVDAFKTVNALTDDEARAVVNRLKNNPCKLY